MHGVGLVVPCRCLSELDSESMMRSVLLLVPVSRPETSIGEQTTTAC